MSNHDNRVTGLLKEISELQTNNQSIKKERDEIYRQLVAMEKEEDALQAAKLL